MQELCNSQMITGFPSIRVYRKGTDDVVVSGRHMHEAYKGDRTEEALKAFIDKLVPTAGTARSRMAETRQLMLGEGCMVCSPPPFPAPARARSSRQAHGSVPRGCLAPAAGTCP